MPEPWISGYLGSGGEYIGSDHAVLGKPFSEVKLLCCQQWEGLVLSFPIRISVLGSLFSEHNVGSFPMFREIS